MSLSTTRHSRRGLLGSALAAGLLAGGSLAVTPTHAAVGCRSDPIVVLSNGVVLDLSATLDADIAQVQAIEYKLHGPKGVWVVRAISTDGAVQYKEKFAFNDDSHSDDKSASATTPYQVEVKVKATDGHHMGWATIAGGYATELGITPDLVGLAAFQFNPSAPQGDKAKNAPKPPTDDKGAPTLPSTVTSALADWAGHAHWRTSMSSPPGQADKVLTATIAL